MDLDRRTFIGGSDTPIILGLSSYKTPYQLYLEKTAEEPMVFEETPYQYWGKALEPLIREEFIKRNGVIMTQPSLQAHPIFDFMCASLDGYIVERNAILEIKCSSTYMSSSWGEPGTDQIPTAYRAQVAHYCAVMGAEKAHIAVLIGGTEYREYVYMRDMTFEDTIIESVCDFWMRVQKRQPPAPSDLKDLALMFPKSYEKALPCTPELAEDIAALQSTKDSLKKLTEIEDSYKVRIMSAMQECDAIVDAQEKPLVTWKSAKTGARRFVVK